MTTVSTADPQFQLAIQACAVALHRMADYELDPSLQRRVHELGERKEFLSSTEHEELLALIDFVHKRTIEKLEAQTALARLRTAIPGVLPDL
jgi:predicted house-cleaning noncanonical NTP pyrophosphatase (MazG superfamily)